MNVVVCKRLLASCIVLFFSNLSFANQISLFVSGGSNYSALKNNLLLEMNEDMTNAYQTSTHSHWNGFWALGVNHTVEQVLLPSYQLSLGLAGYFFQLGDIRGIEYPFINEGLFDSLDYGFRAKSTALMVEAKAAYSQFKVQPYALIGIGPAWNKLYAYHETAHDPSLSASPGAPFSNHTKQVFAYELGAGIQYLLKDDTQHHIQYLASAGYQYINLDKAALGPTSAQTTSDGIKINNLYTQGIIGTLALSFG